MADWDNDGWPDLTFGGTSGAIRTWRNLGGTGFEMMPLPWGQTVKQKRSCGLTLTTTVTTICLCWRRLGDADLWKTMEWRV